LKEPVPEYGGVPPDAVTVTVASPPLQSICVAVTSIESAVGGCVMVIVADVAAQPLSSVTVNVYVPGPREKVPVPEYGGVPPVAETVTVEVPP
jgi:hypothetical protein